jgi:hypothetical protein
LQLSRVAALPQSLLQLGLRGGGGSPEHLARERLLRRQLGVCCLQRQLGGVATLYCCGCGCCRCCRAGQVGAAREWWRRE